MMRWSRLLSLGFFVVASLALAGCNLPQTTLEGQGPAASRIAVLSWAMTITFLVATAIMWILIAAGFWKRRGTLSEHAPIDEPEHGHLWIAIGGLAIPFVVLMVFFILGLSLLSDFPIHGKSAMAANSEESMRPEILVIGHQWWWEIHYLNSDPSKEFITADEIHLPVGRPVYIEVETADVMHSLWLPHLHGKVDLIPGVPNYILIQASQPGDYYGQCAEYCGTQHAHMRLLAVAQEPADYAAWLQHELEPGSQPKTPQEVAGEQIFLSGPCSMCHEVRGTPAGGSVAPDLTHIGSRKYIGADSFPNNNAYLEAWITHAQSLKPDCLMPDLTQFTGPQLQDLVAYLRQLN